VNEGILRARSIATRAGSSAQPVATLGRDKVPCEVKRLKTGLVLALSSEIAIAPGKELRILL
jgi:hypothetical protein